MLFYTFTIIIRFKGYLIIILYKVFIDIAYDLFFMEYSNQEEIFENVN
jgi:hypothetical protein